MPQKLTTDNAKVYAKANNPKSGLKHIRLLRTRFMHIITFNKPFFGTNVALRVKLYSKKCL